jgi:hypothetical protein
MREDYYNHNISAADVDGVNMPADGQTKQLDKIAHGMFV